jgi:F0F1-type ATP synthase assembly protein I
MADEVLTGRGTTSSSTSSRTSRRTTGTVTADSQRTKRAEIAQGAERAARGQGISAGLSIMSYPVAGMIAYGVIGWLIGKAVHISLLGPIGMLVGLGISLGYVIHRYGRQGSLERNDR